MIAGVAPYGDIRTLFAEKIGWAAPSVENAPMLWGGRLEAVIADAYAEETGRRVRRVNRLLQHRELPWMLASLDRVTVGDRRLVEIKTRRFADEAWGPAGSDEIPDHYRLQVLHQMFVTGYQVADLAVLFAGSDLRIYSVPRDDELLADLVSLEQAFWNAVEARSLPAELAELGKQPVPLRAGEVEATDRVTEVAAQLRGARAFYEAAKAEKESLEDVLRTELADVAAARGAGFRISYRPQAERTKVGWEQIATAYQARLVELGADPDELATVRGLYTHSEPGIRPLRINFDKEQPDDSPL